MCAFHFLLIINTIQTTQIMTFTQNFCCTCVFLCLFVFFRKMVYKCLESYVYFESKCKMRLWQLKHSVTRSMLSGYSHYSTTDFRYICVVSNACYVLLLYCYTKNVYFKNKLNVRHTYIYILMDPVIKWKYI